MAKNDNTSPQDYDPGMAMKEDEVDDYLKDWEHKTSKEDAEAMIERAYDRIFGTGGKEKDNG